MADQQIREMISAYAAGCLDVDNFINFKEYLISDGDLPYGELGELQNVIALLALTQDLEQPPVALKASVAKKLISLKGEIKEKLKAEKSQILDKEPSLDKNTKYSVVDEFDKNKQTNFDDKINKTDKAEDVNKFSTKIDTVKTAASDKQMLEPEAELKTSSPKYYTEDVVTKNRILQHSKFGFYGSICAMILLLISFYFIYSNNKELRQELSNLNIVLKENQARLSETQNFINDNKKLIDFFAYNNISTINFENPSSFSNSSGKLFISFEKASALLMINNLPEALPGEMYQLWLVSRGRSYPIISFIPNKSTNYLQISELPKISKSEIDLFRITSEKKPNPDLPEGKTILFGGIQK